MARQPGLEVGAGQSGAAQSVPQSVPQGVPAEVVQRLQELATSVFHQGFVNALTPSMALPIAAMAIAGLLCLLVTRHVNDVTAPEPVRAESQAA